MKIKEIDIVYEKDDYWVLKIASGYEVYKSVVTHSIRVAQIGWNGEQGLEKAKNEIDRRIGE